MYNVQCAKRITQHIRRDLQNTHHSGENKTGGSFHACVHLDLLEALFRQIFFLPLSHFFLQTCSEYTHFYVSLMSFPFPEEPFSPPSKCFSFFPPLSPSSFSNFLSVIEEHSHNKLLCNSRMREGNAKEQQRKLRKYKEHKKLKTFFLWRL